MAISIVECKKCKSTNIIKISESAHPNKLFKDNIVVKAKCEDCGSPVKYTTLKPDSQYKYL